MGSSISRASDGFADLLERRWFAAHNACTAQRHECDYIRQSLELAEQAWKQAYTRLRELEDMRDSLGVMLAEADASHEGPSCPARESAGRRVMSAA